MNNRSPRVSIGLPVYNGEQFIRKALDSLLAQDYEDFELIIADNASEDATQQICEEYAARDRRIRYFRNSVNIGASANFNLVFDLSTGEYFRWAAHDDWCAPEMLGRCVAALDRDPSIVLCSTRTVIVKERSTTQYINCDDGDVPDLTTDVRRRFRRVWAQQYVFPIFGLVRSGVLRQTGLMRETIGADKVLLAELALLGNLWQTPDYHLFYRFHPAKSRLDWSAPEWWNPANQGKIMIRSLTWLGQCLSIVRDAPVGPATKLGLLGDVFYEFSVKHGRRTVGDIYRSTRALVSRLSRRGGDPRASRV